MATLAFDCLGGNPLFSRAAPSSTPVQLLATMADIRCLVINNVGPVDVYLSNTSEGATAASGKKLAVGADPIIMYSPSGGAIYAWSSSTGDLEIIKCQ